MILVTVLLECINALLLNLIPVLNLQSVCITNITQLKVYINYSAMNIPVYNYRLKQ